MGWSGGGDGDEDDEEGDEGCVEGDVRDGGESFGVAVEDEGESVDELVADEDVPGEYDAGSQSAWLEVPDRDKAIQVRMGELPTTDGPAAYRQCYGRTGKDAPCPCEPPGQVTRKPRPSPWRQLARPEVLTARVRKRTRQF